MRVGVSYVFGGQDHEPPGHEDRVFSGLQHPGQIMQSRIRVAAAHAFDERADNVVVLFPAVAQRPVSHRPLHVRHLDDFHAAGGDLQGVEHPASVSAGETHQVLTGLR